MPEKRWDIPYDRAKPFAMGHCHTLALALQRRLGGHLYALWFADDLPDSGPDEEALLPDFIAEGRTDHVFLVLPDDGGAVDALGWSKDAHSVVLHGHWPGGETGCAVTPIDEADVERLRTLHDWKRDVHPDTEAIADRIVALLTAHGLFAAPAATPFR